MTTKIITLDTPIKRGDDAIASIELRKPAAGELRGCSLADLMQLDVAALIRVLPRITTPAITEQEAAKLDPADLLQLGGEVASFLLTRQAKQDVSLPA